MTEQPNAALPVTVSVSVALHVLGGAGWIYLNHVNQKVPMSVISNVELLVKPAQSLSAPRMPQMRRSMPMKPSTWNFLKMALPSVPKTHEPLEIKSPLEEKKKLLDIPKALEENRNKLEKKLDMSQKLDMSKQMNLAKIDATRLESHSRAALADMPKLEDVGTRRASKAVLDMEQALEERKGALEPQDMSSAIHETRHSVSAIQEAALPEEAAPARRGILGKMSDMLTSDEPALPAAQMGTIGSRGLDSYSAPKLPAKESSAMTAKSKKAVELEGQIAHRKVVYYELPKFPKWLAARGVEEAEVRVYFLVTPDGNVLEDNMRVDHTSGFGQLDRLAMASLKNWRFESISGSGNQWGIITFRFVLE